MAPSSFQGPRAETKTQPSTSQDAHAALEKAYSQSTVKNILDEKGREIYSVTASMSMMATASELALRKIGNMPVVEPGGALVGVISERDILRATIDHGESALKRPVRDFMTAAPRTCTSKDRIVDVMKTMSEGHFRHMPVMDNGVLTGTVSILDIVNHRVKEVEFEALRLKQLMVG